MNLEDTLSYLEIKGLNFINDGNNFDDESLIQRGNAYLDIVSELRRTVLRNG